MAAMLEDNLCRSAHFDAKTKDIMYDNSKCHHLGRILLNLLNSENCRLPKTES